MIVFRKKDIICICMLILEIVLTIVIGLLSPFEMEKIALLVSFIAIAFTIAVWLYENYKTRAVKVLYWMAFFALALSISVHYYALYSVKMIVNLVMGYSLAIIAWILYRKQIITEGPQDKKATEREQKKDRFLVIGFCISFIFLFIVVESMDCYYWQGIVLYLIGGIIGLIAGFLVVIFIYTSYKYFKKLKRIFDRFSIIILIVFCGVLIGATTLPALNVGLNGAPEIVTCEVVDKAHDKGYGGRDYYSVEVLFEDKAATLFINSDLYEQISSGDEIEVEYYKGVFGFECLSFPN